MWDSKDIHRWNKWEESGVAFTPTAEWGLIPHQFPIILTGHVRKRPRPCCYM